LKEAEEVEAVGSNSLEDGDLERLRRNEKIGE